MDPVRRLTPEEADAALRRLFHEAGHASAPNGLEARVLARIAVTRRPVPAPPLLPRWAGLGVVVLFLAVITALFFGAGTDASSTGVLPLPDARPVLHWIISPWGLFAFAMAALLFVVDHLDDITRYMVRAWSRP